jgi:hypothetical protein
MWPRWYNAREFIRCTPKNGASSAVLRCWLRTATMIANVRAACAVASTRSLRSPLPATVTRSRTHARSPYPARP